MPIREGVITRGEGNFWKGKNWKNSFIKQVYKQYHCFSNFENTILNLSIHVTRSTVMSIWKIKCKKIYPAF